MASGPELTRLGVILTDRGSRYAVTGARVTSRAEIDAVLAELKTDRAYAKATHNTWAATLPTGALKADDGESGTVELGHSRRTIESDRAARKQTRDLRSQLLVSR